MEVLSHGSGKIAIATGAFPCNAGVMGSSPPSLPPAAPHTSPSFVPFTIQDREHLNTMAIFYWMLGVFGIFSAMGLGLYCIVMGVITQKISGDLAEASDVMPWVEYLPGIVPFLMVIGLGLLVLGVLSAIGKIVCGVFLRKRKRYGYCLFIAALTCLSMPLGTILGIFTFTVLMREQVKRAFKTGEAPVNPLTILPGA